MTSPHPAPGRVAWNVVGAACFATMGFVVHLLGPGCDFRIVVLWRAVLSVALAWGLARRAGASWGGPLPPAVWARSGCGAGAQLMTFYALGHLPASDVVTLRNTSPIWIALLAGPLLGEPTRRGAYAAVGLGILGVVLVERPRLVALDPPVLWMLVSSVLTALAMMALSRCGEVDRNLVVAHFSAAAGLGALLLLALGPAPDWGVLARPRVVAGLVAVGVLGCCAQLAMTHAYARGAATSLSVVGLTQVVFAFALDRLGGVRGLELVEAVGVAMILAGAALVARPGAGAVRDAAAPASPEGDAGVP